MRKSNRTRWILGPAILRYLGAAAVWACLLPTAMAHAAELRSGRTVVLRTTETLQDDLYTMGNTVQILGTIDGDLVVAGEEVSVVGTVGGDLIAVGGTVTISGTVNGVVRALGARVTLDAPVEFDALLGGGEIVVGPSAHVHRDVILGFGEATVAGKVDRNVRAWTERLSLASTAVIGGDVVYAGGKTLQRDPKAIVTGSATQTERDVVVPVGAGARQVRAAMSAAREYAGFAIVALLLTLLAPAFARTTAATLAASPWASLGLGAALLVVVPLVTVPLTVLGMWMGFWWVGLAGIGLWLMALPLAYTVGCLRLGLWATMRLGGRWSGMVPSALIGLAAVAILGSIPIAGWLVRGAALIFGLGALGLSVARNMRRQRATEDTTVAMAESTAPIFSSWRTPGRPGAAEPASAPEPMPERQAS